MQYFLSNDAIAPDCSASVGAGPRTLHVGAPAMFADILRSVRIKDYGLFG